MTNPTSHESSISGVFYIDGSCRPHNPGFIGWGLHGYWYQELSEKPVQVENFYITTHGYQSTNQTLSEPIKFVTPTEYVDGLGSDKELLSNNAAEIKGLMNLLQHIQNKNLHTVRIYTDSEYLQNCMNSWCRQWEQNQWKKRDGLPVSNKEFIEKTYSLWKEMKTRCQVLTLEWIKAHNGHLGNERADVLAGIGMSYSQNRIPLTRFDTEPAKGYWKADIEKHPYIAHKRLFFNTVKDYHRQGVYHLEDSSETEFVVGKPSDTTSYSILYLNEPEQTIETVMEKQFDHSRGLNAISLMKLDHIFSKHVYPWLQKHSHFPLLGNKNGHGVQMVNKTPITVEMSPAGLSMRALDHFALLEEILNQYKNKDPEIKTGASLVKTTDITERFFQPTVNGKGVEKLELRSEFIVGFKSLPMMIDYEHNGKTSSIKIPYQLGLDCLPRNNLKYLETLHPKITLLLWEEGHILRYATIIESDVGIGIWANYFANRIVLPIK